MAFVPPPDDKAPTAEDLAFISALVRQRSGLVLGPDKAYLLESRLLPLARKKGLRTVTDLVNGMRERVDEPLAKAITEALTTNETFFFRDDWPFTTFREHILPEMLEKRAGQKSLRIWCAAASTGQEPYSLAMILKEFGARLDGWRIEIVGTDISAEALARAKIGTFSQFEVQRGLPMQLLVKYFDKKDPFWEIDPAIRAMVRFREFNLLDSLTPLGRFDVVFCRNVLIYFDTETKADTLKRVRRQMPNDGVLFLGSSETVIGVTEHFRVLPERRGIYGTTAVERGRVLA